MIKMLIVLVAGILIGAVASAVAGDGLLSHPVPTYQGTLTAYVMAGGNDDAGVSHALRMSPDGRVLADCKN